MPHFQEGAAPKAGPPRGSGREAYREASRLLSSPRTRLSSALARSGNPRFRRAADLLGHRRIHERALALCDAALLPPGGGVEDDLRAWRVCCLLELRRDRECLHEIEAHFPRQGAVLLGSRDYARLFPNAAGAPPPPAPAPPNPAPPPARWTAAAPLRFTGILLAVSAFPPLLLAAVPAWRGPLAWTLAAIVAVFALRFLAGRWSDYRGSLRLLERLQRSRLFRSGSRGDQEEAFAGLGIPALPVDPRGGKPTSPGSPAP